MAAAITSRRFDLHHGDNIELSLDNRLATRKQGFDRGLCAMEMPLVNESLHPLGSSDKHLAHVSLLVTRTAERWNGGLGLGVSTQDPSHARLPSSALGAGRGWAFAQVPQTALAAGAGTLVTVWLDLSARELCYAVTQANKRMSNALEGEAEGDAQKGEVLLDDPAILDCLDAKLPLWFYVDIYGFVVQVQILGSPPL